jgi:hypothetical protein
LTNNPSTTWSRTISAGVMASDIDANLTLLLHPPRIPRVGKPNISLACL